MSEDRAAPSREALARLIEPRAWMTVREIAAAKGLDAANPALGVIIMQEIDQLVAMQGLRDQSLSKADQIIAAFREAGR